MLVLEVESVAVVALLPVAVDAPGAGVAGAVEFVVGAAGEVVGAAVVVEVDGAALVEDDGAAGAAVLEVVSLC